MVALVKGKKMEFKEKEQRCAEVDEAVDGCEAGVEMVKSILELHGERGDGAAA